MFVLDLYAKPLNLTLLELNQLIPETHITLIRSKENDLTGANMSFPLVNWSIVWHLIVF